MKYSVIVPCYNEEDNICRLVEVLEKTAGHRKVEFILVENGSQDNTRQVLEETCKDKNIFKIVRVDKNRGYGYGIICGMRAATGDYIGWLHADLQSSPESMMKFIDYIEKKAENKILFLKAVRRNRSLTDYFFTWGMAGFATLVLCCNLYDIGAVPILFHKSLLKRFDKRIPYDFAIDTYVYYQAKRFGMDIKRFKIMMNKRVQGESSWNKGLMSRIRQSKIIMSDIIKIKKGVKVR